MSYLHRQSYGMQSTLFNIDSALLTTHTVARRWREGDGAAFYTLVQRNSSYISDHFPHLTNEIVSEEAAEAFVRERLAGWLLQTSYAFGIWRNKEADLVGYVHLDEIQWDIPRADLAYFLDHEHTQKGIMTEVVSRVIQFAFKQLAINKLRLLTLVDNYPSQRLARKVGFRREGDIRAEFRKPSGALLDLMAFGLTREEYGL